MSFIERIKNLFSSSNNEQEAKDSMQGEATERIDDGYEVLPEYIESDSIDYTLVSTIATAIAAGDQPESEFKVKNILVKNPEFVKVSVIMSSIVACDMQDSSWKITNIKKRGN